MPADLFDLWQASYDKDPWGGGAEAYEHGYTRATLANCHRDPAKRPYVASDFTVRRGKRKKKAEGFRDLLKAALGIPITKPKTATKGAKPASAKKPKQPAKGRR